MASVYCSRCDAKITAADSVCPSCGSPTSRLIPLVLGIAVIASGILLFNSYRQIAGNTPGEVDADRSNATLEEKEPQSRVSFFE